LGVTATQPFGAVTLSFAYFVAPKHNNIKTPSGCSCLHHMMGDLNHVIGAKPVNFITSGQKHIKIAL
jgi:hypothetical protein